LYKMFAYVAMPRRNHRLARSMFIRESAKISEPEFKRWAKLIADLPDFMKQFDNKFYSAPTFYLCGAEDYLFTDSIKKTVAKHPNTMYYFIKGAGHVCNIEKAEIFNEQALDFLKKHND
jgi:pimeloyl-ACP methyl ester carboxylesterase